MDAAIFVYRWFVCENPIW